jgi:hypothetical protein
MQSKTILKVENPTTQSIDSVKSLLSYVGRASDPLPTDVSLENGRVVLILSNKKDCYYVATQKTCSCPANTWHPGQPCKHQRNHLPQVATTAATKPAATGSLIKRGGFKPFDEMPGEEKVKASSLSVVDCFDTTALDVAYWSIKQDRDMWPMCEA